MREVIVKTEGTTEPVTLAQAKVFINYLGDDASVETLIQSLLLSARIKLEQFTGRNFVEKTMILSTDNAGISIELPFGPIYSVTSVKVYDTYGVLNQTLTEDEDYYLIGNFDKYVRLESFFNGAYLDVEYTSGYHSTHTYELPEVMKNAIKRQVKYDFDNRGNTSAEPIVSEVKTMLAPYVCNFL